MIIRWLCEKCNKKWIYPIQKCVYCKGPIVKQRGNKLKIIGITKVSIPSPMHPVIPYNIILLEDENGNRIPKKTMKDYKIGQEYIEQKAQTKSAVCITKVKYDVFESISETADLSNIDDFSSDDKILVKPSIVTAAYPYQAVNTEPEFLDGLLRFLLSKGIKKENILVAEQALIGSKVGGAAAKAGILSVCKKNGVEFKDISEGPFEEIESEGMKFNVYKEAIGRKVINCPVMKTNFQIGISGAIENLSRLVDAGTQKSMYENDINKTLPKLSRYFSKIINIADATKGLQGQGPLSMGEPAFLNIILAGKDAGCLDTVFCEIAMLSVPEHVKNSSGFDVKKIEVVGGEIDAARYSIKRPTTDETPHPDIKVIDGRASPVELGILYSTTVKLIGLRGEEINIVMGSYLTKEMLEGKERIVALGEPAFRKLKELGVKCTKLDENLDPIEQILLLKKLLVTKGEPKLTQIDIVKSKMKKLLSRVIK